jgi:hypothetical protein
MTVRFYFTIPDSHPKNNQSSNLSAIAAANPKIAMFRQAEVSFAAAAFEVLVPTTFPLSPQSAPKHAPAVEIPAAAAVVVGEDVIKKPC